MWVDLQVADVHTMAGKALPHLPIIALSLRTVIRPVQKTVLRRRSDLVDEGTTSMVVTVDEGDLPLALPEIRGRG